MRKLGEQWVEEIDGQEHMVKCIGLADDMSIITKDIGVLNEDGCLPVPWDKTFYPNIYEGLLTIYTSNRRVLVCCEDDDMSMFVNGKTRQEAIDRWNRRA